MESGYEFDSFSELPPLPQVYDPMEYSTSYPYAITPLKSLPPFPQSDFTPHGGFTFSDTHQNFLHLQQHATDSFFPDSSLSLVTRNNLTESTRFEKLFPCDLVATPFLHLPELRSLEQSTAMKDTKSPFLSLAPPLPVSTKHDGNVKRHNVKSRFKSSFTISPPSSSKSKSPTPSSSQSIHGERGRRRKISDKIRSLEKLMPWENKMSLAMILEEMHKYVTFLQSQIASLRWMPLESVYPSKPRETSLLNSLTRQQILQVIANSPGSRNVLYTRGVCVFSYEQLLSVKMMAESARNL